MGLSIAGIICTITFKLVGCPKQEPPPPPPIQSAPADNDPAQVLQFLQQPVASGTKPRNLIIFVADGMGGTLVAATRARLAQRASAPPAPPAPAVPAPAAGADPDPATQPAGASEAAIAATVPATADPTTTPPRLSFELFPATATPASIPPALAAHDFTPAISPLRTRARASPPTVGMNAKAEPDRCPEPGAPAEPAKPPEKDKAAEAAKDQNPAPPLRQNEVPTLLELAKRSGFAAGVVSTSRITLAAPAATYAHSANRNWEVDSRMPKAALDAGCRDIARQLIEFDNPARPDPKFDDLVTKFARKASKKAGVELDLNGLASRHGGLDVIMGGGRIAFLPEGVPDPVNSARRGVRSPVGQGGVDLIAQWRERNPGGVLVTGASALKQNVQTAGPLLGLFAPDHMAFESDRQQQGLDQPSLGMMVTAAIDRLSRSTAGTRRGYVLIVDAGGIDRAAITKQGDQAIEEVLALSDAVMLASAMTGDKNDTLIIVVASHGQTMVPQGQNAAALVGFDGEDTTIYARGPGAQWIHGVINMAALHNVLAAAMLIDTPATPSDKD